MSTFTACKTISRGACVLACAALMACLMLTFASSSWASFGVESVAIQAQEENGEAATQAGSHPYSLTTTILFNHHEPTELQREGGLGGGGNPRR